MITQLGRRDLTLPDGARLWVRPIRPEDDVRLAAGFTRLSARSRRARFLTGKERLSATELRYFTDVDHHDHDALCAFQAANGQGVGVARYVRYADRPQTAEVALTILDAWQHRGVGTQLLPLLMNTAARVGIRNFRAFIAADNAEALGLLRKVGGELRLIANEPGVAEYDVALPHQPARQSTQPAPTDPNVGSCRTRAHRTR